LISRKKKQLISYIGEYLLPVKTAIGQTTGYNLRWSLK
jgi:hypothetical protein